MTDFSRAPQFAHISTGYGFLDDAGIASLFHPNLACFALQLSEISNKPPTSIPKAISTRSPQLQSLIIHEYEIGPTWINGLTKSGVQLQQFHLEYCTFRRGAQRALVAFLSHSKDLSYLTLKPSNLPLDLLATSLALCNHELRYLCIPHSPMYFKKSTGSVLKAWFASATSLTSLDLSHCFQRPKQYPLARDIGQAISQAPNLTILCLENCHLTPVFLGMMDKPPSHHELAELHLNRSMWNDDTVVAARALSRAYNIHCIGLSYFHAHTTQLDWTAFFEALASFPELIELNLVYPPINPAARSRFMIEMAETMSVAFYGYTSLQRLDMHSSWLQPNAKMDLALSMLDTFPRLTHFKFMHNWYPKLNDAAVTQLLGSQIDEYELDNVQDLGKYGARFMRETTASHLSISLWESSQYPINLDMLQALKCNTSITCLEVDYTSNCTSLDWLPVQIRHLKLERIGNTGCQPLIEAFPLYSQLESIRFGGIGMEGVIQFLTSPCVVESPLRYCGFIAYPAPVEVHQRLALAIQNLPSITFDVVGLPLEAHRAVCNNRRRNATLESMMIGPWMPIYLNRKTRWSSMKLPSPDVTWFDSHPPMWTTPSFDVYH